MSVLPKLSFTKLENLLKRKIRRANARFNLIREGDRILVGLSGGVDSSALLKLLVQSDFIWYQKVTFFPFYVDIGFKDTDPAIIPDLQQFCRDLNLELQYQKTSIADSAFSPEAPFNPCFTCSRMRRKTILEKAEELNCSKIAFAHHKDDVIETLFLNLLFSKEISTMVPRQELFQGKYYIIRPLVFCDEAYLKAYTKQAQIAHYDNPCPIAGKTKRNEIKTLLLEFEKRNPGCRENIFRALFRVKLDYLYNQYRENEG
ncbi:tRNA 2-thiocytidine(32) synthetase TtcA [bacterium]|nr:tRNA 2-thiocytidine(32) synthetase TtcA [bacterium]